MPDPLRADMTRVAHRVAEDAIQRLTDLAEEFRVYERYFRFADREGEARHVREMLLVTCGQIKRDLLAGE